MKIPIDYRLDGGKVVLIAKSKEDLEKLNTLYPSLEVTLDTEIVWCKDE